MHPSKQTFTRRDFLATTAGISMLAGGAMPAPAAPQAARPSGALWPPFEKLQARLEQWQGDFKSLCEVEILGKSAQGRPLYAARLTDSSAPDEDKEHVLLTALHSGIERSGTTSLFSMMRWLLLSGDPVAHEILRRQIVIVMPVPNPDGYVLGSSSNTADLWAYQSWTLDGPMNPEKNPEGVAVQTIMDRFQPEVHADLHGVDLAFPGNIMIEESGRAYSNVALRPFYHAVVTQMNAAAAAEGYPSDKMEEDSEQLLWGPALDSIAEKTWGGRARPYAATYCYSRYHTMILASEIAWERSGVLRHRRLLQIGNETWPGEYYPGYPTRVVRPSPEHMVTAYGRTAAERRASRVEIWTKLRQITAGVNDPGVEGMAVFVCATSPTAANQWLSDATLVGFAHNIRKHPQVNAEAIRQFVERYPHPDYPGQWGREAQLALISKLPPPESAEAPAIEHGLALRLRIPYAKSRITDLRLNGYPIPRSETNGYVDWVARAWHYIQVNIPPEKSKSERFFIVTCGYDPGEHRVQADEWQ